MPRLLLCLIFASLFAGCATEMAPTPTGMRVNPAPSGERVVVVSYRPVRVPAESLSDQATGATLGYLAGNAVATKLTSSDFAGYAAGAAAGYAGYLVAKDMSWTGGIEIVVRRANGQQLIITQVDDGWKPWIGQEARLIEEDGQPRIVR